MKVLLCHNFYQQEGGEDLSFQDESWLLKSRGHEVIRYTVHNNKIAEMGRMRLAARSIWSRETYRCVRQIVRRERPELVHCTNTFPLISPAVYYAARQEGAAVVQALRNYRLICPSALLMRDNRPCEDCLGKVFAWPAITHACYRHSRAASSVVASLSAIHRLLGTWSKQVDLFFTLTSFARERFIAAGLPAERILVKPNFVHPDLGAGDGSGGYAVYVGRLSEEKGIQTLLDAWKHIGADIPLKIVGDGPMQTQVREACQRDRRLQWLGRQDRHEVAKTIGEAACLILPSICYETFGRTIVEAYNRGTPVIASRLGAMAELVRDEETGFHFTAGDARDLAAKAARLFDLGARLPRLRQQARRAYQEKYTADENYRALLDIYRRAIELRRGETPPGHIVRRAERTCEREVVDEPIVEQSAG